MARDKSSGVLFSYLKLSGDFSVGDFFQNRIQTTIRQKRLGKKLLRTVPSSWLAFIVLSLPFPLRQRNFCFNVPSHFQNISQILWTSLFSFSFLDHSAQSAFKQHSLGTAI